MAATSKISSLRDYIAATQRVMTSWGYSRATIQPWFRGHGESAWPLLPGLYRTPAIPSFEREILREFKLRAHQLVHPLPTSDIEWLFVMQHYGAPTRLLDWTESNLTGLFFALAHGSRRDAAVWMLDPWSLNRVALRQKTVPPATDIRLAAWIIETSTSRIARRIQAEWPVAVRPQHASDRITVQRGTFTLHGRRHVLLDEVPEVRLEKIVINGRARARMFKELWMSGVTSASLFPGLDGIATELSYRFGRSYFKSSRRRVRPRSSRPDDLDVEDFDLRYS